MDTKESLAVNIYNDLGSPAMKQVGLSVENLLKFVALPFKFLGLTAEQLEKKYLQFIEKAINQVPPEKLIKPQSSVIAPLLDNVKFCFPDEPGNDILQNMFSNLLSSSMNQDYKHCLQKSFIEKMRFLSGDEARLLKWCSDAIITEKAHNNSKLSFGGFSYIASFSIWDDKENVKSIEIPATTPGTFPYLNFPVVETLELLSSLGFISIKQEWFSGYAFFEDIVSFKSKNLISVEIPTPFDKVISQITQYPQNVISPSKEKHDDCLLQCLLESEIPQLNNMLCETGDFSVDQILDMRCSRIRIFITQYGYQFLRCCIA